MTALFPMTVLDVGKYITMMDNNKSMGHDNINPFLLKLALPYSSASHLYIYIYILSIRNNVFPTTLKKAKVIPLPKTYDLNETNNFHPISILSLLSKPIERDIRYVYIYIYIYIPCCDIFKIIFFDLFT